MSTPQNINDGGPAFPSSGNTFEEAVPGMSLRDWFAGKIASGDAAADTGWVIPNDGDDIGAHNCSRAMKARAKFYYRMADAMLLARESPTKKCGK